MKTIYWLIFTCYYLPWSKLYQYVERRFTKDYAEKRLRVLAVFEDAKKLVKFPLLQYTYFWSKKFPNIKWKADKWYMLWDVIADPFLMLLRGGDDCDNFAFLARELFTDKFKDEKGDVFTFRSVFFLMKKPEPWPSGHAVAVWENPTKGIAVVSNQQLKFFSSEQLFLELRKSKGHPAEYIVEVTHNLTVETVRKVLYE